MRVVPALQVLEDGEARVGLRREAMAIEQDDWKLHDKTMKKANKVLSPFNAALFNQIHARIRTAARYERALQVPLIN